MNRNFSQKTFILSFILIFCFIFSPLYTFTANANEIPEKPDSIYVYDSAEVLSDSAEENLLSRAINLYNHTETQICVVTVNTLNGANIEEYANNILKEWKIGGEKGRGLILLLSIEEDIYVTISGDELKSKFTSEVLQNLLNEKLEPHFLVSQYEDGVNAFFTEVYYMAEDFAEELESEAPTESLQVPDKEVSDEKEGVSFWTVLLIIILVLILLIAAFFVTVYIRGQIVRKRRREAARRRREAQRRTEKSRRDYL